MRINKFVAQATGLSRRAADKAVEEGRVAVNGRAAGHGTDVNAGDSVSLDGAALSLPEHTQTIMMNKPAGYICSREGQGGRTVYDLLPAEFARLKPVGRLDKDSSGLLLMTDDGALADRLTHPRYTKQKVYEVGLDRPLDSDDAARLARGVELEDGMSELQVSDLRGKQLTVTMSEGRNRQIRRTFDALGYRVVSLHRTAFGPYALNDIKPGKFNFVIDRL